jgi:small basic protein (TIGR04137 family)
MSLHPSLKIDTAGAQQRSVLTRIERMKDLMKKGLLKEDGRAIGLPKTKIVKIKARKTVKAAAVDGAAAPAPAAGAKAAGKAAPKK